MAQPRKTKRRWDPRKAANWGRIQRERNALRRSQGFKSGNPPGSPAAGDAAGNGRPVDAGPGDGNQSHPGGSGKGTYDIPPDTGEPSQEARTETGNEKPLDLEAIWTSLPEFWKMVVLGLQNWADLFNWSQQKIYVIFVPLNDKEAKTLAAFSRPFLEAKLPEWIKRNPGLAICMVPLFILLFKVRITMKKPKPAGPPGQKVVELLPDGERSAA